jgi:hypothetical protein
MPHHVTYDIIQHQCHPQFTKHAAIFIFIL